MSYHDHAYERSVVAWLQRLMLDRVIQSESPPKEAIVCEEVFHAEREVPQEVLLRVFNKLGMWEGHERTQMNNYRWVKEEPPPFMKQQPPAAPGAPAPTEAPAPEAQAQQAPTTPEAAPPAKPAKDSFYDFGPEAQEEEEEEDDGEDVATEADSAGEREEAGRQRARAAAVG